MVESMNDDYEKLYKQINVEHFNKTFNECIEKWETAAKTESEDERHFAYVEFLEILSHLSSLCHHSFGFGIYKQILNISKQVPEITEKHFDSIVHFGKILKSLNVEDIGLATLHIEGLDVVFSPATHDLSGHFRMPGFEFWTLDKKQKTAIELYSNKNHKQLGLSDNWILKRSHFDSHTNWYELKLE